MMTRKQYMDGDVSHEDYYSQFVTPAITAIVKERIGVERIERSTDPHLNDIPLSKWDALQPVIAHEAALPMKECGDWLSMASCVCIAKQAAKMLAGKAVR